MSSAAETYSTLPGNVIPFAFEDSLVRTVKKDDEPWFVGKDVCAVLKISDHHQALARLDDDERGGCSVPTPRGAQELIIVSEAGVYRLIFTSRKPEAERFKRWLAHEVLPSLRRTGSYVLPASAEHEEDEPEPIDNEPITVLNVKLAMLREARALFGPAIARTLWAQLGMPAMPVVEIAAETTDPDAVICLRHILSHKLVVEEPGKEAEEQTFARIITRALDGDDTARYDLMCHGIRIEEGEDGEAFFWISSYGPSLRKIFDGTPWAETWRFALKKLAGAKGTGNYKVEGETHRGTRIPERWLEEAFKAA